MELKSGDKVHVEFDAVYRGRGNKDDGDWAVFDHKKHKNGISFSHLLWPSDLDEIVTKIEAPFNDGDIVRDGDGDIFRYNADRDEFRWIWDEANETVMSFGSWISRARLANPVVKLTPEA